MKTPKHRTLRKAMAGEGLIGMRRTVADVMTTEIVSVTAALELMAMLSRPDDEPRWASGTRSARAETSPCPAPSGPST